MCQGYVSIISGFLTQRTLPLIKNFSFVRNISYISILGNVCQNMCPFRLTALLPPLSVFVSCKKHAWICKIHRRLMDECYHYLLWLRSDSILLTDPYGQCEFSDGSGFFLIDNLMRSSSWQVDGVSLQPAQTRSVGACVQAFPIGAFRKNSRSVKIFTFSAHL